MANLEQLKSTEFLDSIGLIELPSPLSHVLAKNTIVDEIRTAIVGGEITTTDINDFVKVLMNDLKLGASFKYDLTLAALVVCLRDSELEIAKEFIHDLAKLKLVEMWRSIRVARHYLN